MIRRLLSVFALVAAIVLASSPARAAWHEAKSDRFVIYSDSRAEDLKSFAEMLERFHVAMELETGRKVPAPSPSNRLTIYMVGSRDDLRRVYGNRNSSVAGFYIPRANGSVVFTPNIKISTRDVGRSGGFSRISRGAANGLSYEFTILLHEYAHHFLISSARHAMPRWLSEGAAEYFASANFHDDGSVDIGLPNNDRAYEISQAAEVPVIQLLDYEQYRENRGRRYDAFYGRSWLLYHYLRFAPQRDGQLVKYWQAVASGTDSLEAAKSVFGDIDKLEKEVSAYGRQRSMPGMRYSASDISIGSVSVAKLTEGHAGMMDIIIRSKRGVDEAQAAEIVEKARAVAGQHPEDPAVLEALAEAEYDAGNDDAAIAAADRAIAASKWAKNAYVQKGYAMFRKAGDADDKKAAFTAAMKPFEALNALEADHTQPLIYYYRSFTRRGVRPPDGAKAALERATQLAPFDKDLAVEVAAMFALDGDPVIASYLLRPVAANPHGGKQARVAQGMINHLNTRRDGTRVDFYKVMKQLEEAEESDNEDGEDGEE